MKRSVKIIIALLLVGAISTTTIRNAEAQGAEGVVQVVGGSIAAGGIAAGIAAVAPPALIIIGLVMVAQGIDVALTEASQAEGMTKGEFIQSKFEDFCEYTKKDFERTCNTIVSGAKILADGTIWIADEAGNAISQFINNLLVNEDVKNVSDVIATSEKSIIINNVKYPLLSRGDYIYPGDDVAGNPFKFMIENNSTDLYYGLCCWNSGSAYTMYIFTSQSATIWYSVNDVSPSPYGISQRINNYYYGNITTIFSNPTIPVVSSIQDVLNNIDSWPKSDADFQGGVLYDSFVKDDNVDISTNVLNPSNGNDIVINTGLNLGDIGQSYGDVGLISVNDYLDTLRDAINGVTDLTIAVQNVATGVIDDVSVGVYSPTDVAVSNEAEEEAENQIATPVIDVNEFPSGEAAEQALNGLQFDLTKIFPFCIPFDIVHIIQKFDVPRQIPHIQISLPLPGVGETLDLDLDLKPFDGVATVLRTMELIAFVVGLAMVTRGLIRG